MKRVRSFAEFGLVAALGVTLTMQATSAHMAQHAPAPAPAPSMAEIEAAVDFAERQALEVNGRR